MMTFLEMFLGMIGIDDCSFMRHFAKTNDTGNRIFREEIMV